MSFLNFFNANNRKKEKDYLKQLFMVALADGSMDDVEKQYILSIGARFNISASEIEEIIQNLNPEDVKYQVPGDTEEKFYMLFYLINLIRADGEIHPHEIKVAENIVMRLGYAPDTVSIILQTIEHNQKQNISVEETYQHLKKRLG